MKASEIIAVLIGLIGGIGISLFQKTTSSFLYLIIYSLIFLITILIILMTWVVFERFSEIDLNMEEKIERKLKEKFKIQERLINIEERLYKLENG